MKRSLFLICVGAPIGVVALLLGACGGGADEKPPAVIVPPDQPPARPTGVIVIEPTPNGSAAGPTTPPEDTPDADPPDGDFDSLLIIVDKQHALPSYFVPPGLASIPSSLSAPGFGGDLLRREALDALSAMLSAADGEGYDIRVRSAYRSYSEQVQTYAYWVGVYGEEEASRISARPGHSEHQLGTAADITSASAGWELEEGFESTAEGEWLAAHAYEYGFALSYPEDKETVTGYRYEPWHWRYIGIGPAQEWWDSGLTLVEFLTTAGG